MHLEQMCSAVWSHTIGAEGRDRDRSRKCWLNHQILMMNQVHEAVCPKQKWAEDSPTNKMVDM